MILITGVAGFIGTHLALRLLAEGNEVVGLDNLHNIYDVSLKKHRLSLLEKHANFSFYNTDISHLDETKKIFKTHVPKIVIHLASRAGVRNSFIQPEEYVINNVLSTNNILQLCSQLVSAKIILASSSSVYAQNNQASLTVSPFKEDMFVNKPFSPYASSKIAAEVLSSSFYYHFDSIESAVNLRFFTVYGPFGRPDMSIFKFIQNILNNQTLYIFGDGSQKRAFTYIDDIVDGIIAASTLDGHHVLNLGNNHSHSVLDLISYIETSLGKKANIEFQEENKLDINATLPDLSNIQNTLGWSPKIDLKKGIEHTVAWHTANRDIADSIQL